MRYFFFMLLNIIAFHSMFAINNKSINKDTPIDFPHNLIFVSPHPDDILLTFAGLIDNNNGFINHNTQSMVFFNTSQHTMNSNPSDLSKERTKRVSMQRYLEETSAINDLFQDKARLETYGYLDAPLRHYKGHKTVTAGPGGNFNTFGIQEISIYNQLIAILKNKLQTTDCAMFVLMANGSHIDHYIVREAVITAAKQLGNKATCKIYFGQDQPYTGANPENSKKEMINFQKRLSLQKISYKINHTNKINNFAKHYISQYSEDYAIGINTWANVNNGKEDIFFWDPKLYAQAPIDISCNQTFCK